MVGPTLGMETVMDDPSSVGQLAERINGMKHVGILGFIACGFGLHSWSYVLLGGKPARLCTRCGGWYIAVFRE